MRTREGRRRRHRRHKLRAKRMLIRRWTAQRIGDEWRALEAFMRREATRGHAVFIDGPKHGEHIMLERGRRCVEVASMPPVEVWFRGGQTPPNPTVVRYELNRMAEGRFFFDGTVRRHIDRETLLTSTPGWTEARLVDALKRIAASGTLDAALARRTV